VGMNFHLEHITQKEFNKTHERAKKITQQINGLMNYLKNNNKEYTKWF